MSTGNKISKINNCNYSVYENFFGTKIGLQTVSMALMVQL